MPNFHLHGCVGRRHNISRWYSLTQHHLSQLRPKEKLKIDAWRIEPACALCYTQSTSVGAFVRRVPSLYGPFQLAQTVSEVRLESRCVYVSNCYDSRSLLGGHSSVFDQFNLPDLVMGRSCRARAEVEAKSPACVRTYTYKYIAMRVW